MRLVSLSLLALFSLCACAAAQGTWVFGGDFQIIGTDLSSAVSWSDGTYKSIGGGVPYIVDGARTGMEVQVIEEHSGSLYLGGEFSFQPAGSSMTLNRIGRWDGNQWDDLAGGLGSPCEVVSLAFQDDLVFVGIYGSCNTTSGVSVSGVAIYSPMSGWNNMAGGLGATTKWNAPVAQALAVQDDLLAVGGFFETAGGANASLLAWWNISAQAWSDLSYTPEGQLQLLPDQCGSIIFDNHTFPYCFNPSSVSQLALYGSQLIIGGTYVLPDGMITTSNFSLLSWTPSTGLALLPNAPRLSAAPSAFAPSPDGSLYVGVGRDILQLSPSGNWTSLQQVSTYYVWPWVYLDDLITDENGTLYAFGGLPAFTAGVAVFVPSHKGSDPFSYTANSMWATFVVPPVENALFTARLVSRDYGRTSSSSLIAIKWVYIVGITAAIGGLVVGSLMYFVGRRAKPRTQYEVIG